MYVSTSCPICLVYCNHLLCINIVVNMLMKEMLHNQKLIESLELLTSCIKLKLVDGLMRWWIFWIFTLIGSTICLEMELMMLVLPRVGTGLGSDDMFVMAVSESIKGISSSTSIDICFASSSTLSLTLSHRFWRQLTSFSCWLFSTACLSAQPAHKL